MHTLTNILLSEYETTIADVSENATDNAIIAALVRDGDWAERGAREILHLARTYGTSILRNALALAAAMQIEDGESRALIVRQRGVSILTPVWE